MTSRSTGTYPNNQRCEKTRRYGCVEISTSLRKSVGNSRCKINAKPPASELVLDFESKSATAKRIYVLVKAEGQKDKVEVVSPPHQWAGVILYPGITKTREFEILQSKQADPGTGKVNIEVHCFNNRLSNLGEEDIEEAPKKCVDSHGHRAIHNKSNKSRVLSLEVNLS